MRVRFYLKSGNSFVVYMESLRREGPSLRWKDLDGQTQNSLLDVVLTEIEAVVIEDKEDTQENWLRGRQGVGG